MKFRRLKANEIDARVSTISDKGCSLLLYKDARVDQNILDETVGAENWQRSHELIGDRLYCTVSIWDEKKQLWVSKQDVGTESYTEKEKGQASDSFKRACFNWGIGRELYTAPFIWITAGNVSLSNKNGKQTTYDTFSVKEIGYNDLGEINRLKIQNDKQKKIVYTFGAEQEFPKELEPITANEQEVLKALCARKGLDPAKSFPNGIDKLTAEQYAQAVAKLGKLKDAT
jgi:hypothetical protein